MHFKTVFASVMIFWSSLYLIHSWLRSSSRFARRYSSLLDKLGLSLHAGQVRWYTTRYNRFFIRLAQCRSRLWNWWFGAGAICGVVLSLVSAVILASVLYDGIWSRFVVSDGGGVGEVFGVAKSPRSGLVRAASESSSSSSASSRATPLLSSTRSNRLLTPILPGVNLPANQMGYYLFTLFLCGVLHEIGHAVAANCNNVRVNGFGCFVALIYPGAFVDLNSESLQAAKPWHRLKIYCAGVWHNAVIVAAAVAYLRFSSAALFPFYSVGDGAVVSAVSPDSVISGKRGLHVGDVIAKVANCRVRSAEDWRRCLLNQTLSAAHEIPGYCVPVGYIFQHRRSRTASIRGEGGTKNNNNNNNNNNTIKTDPIPHDETSLDCCDANHTAKDLCFSYRSKEHISTQSACLPARSVSERPSCRVNADCVGGRRVKADVSNSVCVFPSVGNRTRLLRIARPPNSAILFLGNPLELRFTVRVIDFRRRFRLFPVNAPPVVELCCKYLASLSGALALLNVVPCYALDGQFILASIVDIFLPPDRFSAYVRDAVYYGCCLVGTVLLLTNVMLAFYNLL